MGVIFADFAARIDEDPDLFIAAAMDAWTEADPTARRFNRASGVARVRWHQTVKDTAHALLDGRPLDTFEGMEAAAARAIMGLYALESGPEFKALPKDGPGDVIGVIFADAPEVEPLGRVKPGIDQGKGASRRKPE